MIAITVTAMLHLCMRSSPFESSHFARAYEGCRAHGPLSRVVIRLALTLRRHGDEACACMARDAGLTTMPDFRLWRGQPRIGGTSEEPPDAELVRQMRLGHERALEGLYVRYGGLAYTLALRIVGDRELARQVLQDPCLRAWTATEDYAAQRGRVP